MKRSCTSLLFLFTLIVLIGCKSDNELSDSNFKTKNIIIILIDGPRYSETWGDSTHQYIKGQEMISKEGVVFTDFYNDGTTNTVNGHAAITTGHYESLENTGTEIPTNPSLFQMYLNNKKAPATDAWIISSKDKLQVLGDCKNGFYNGHFIPQSDCGNNGLYTGYREDSVTYSNAVHILTTFHPRLAFISFKQPDSYGHMNDWNNYLSSLKQSDAYAFQIFQLLQSDPIYKNSTTLFITNDHGRHLDSVADGFVSHGDSCLGCRHIMLLATGPDFKKNTVIDKHYNLCDINATISYLLGFKNTGTGVIITDLFK